MTLQPEILAVSATSRVWRQAEQPQCAAHVINVSSDEKLFEIFFRPSDGIWPVLAAIPLNALRFRILVILCITFT
jgi:hypothetical protein